MLLSSSKTHNPYLSTVSKICSPLHCGALYSLIAITAFFPNVTASFVVGILYVITVVLGLGHTGTRAHSTWTMPLIHTNPTCGMRHRLVMPRLVIPLMLQLHIACLPCIGPSPTVVIALITVDICLVTSAVVVESLHLDDVS